MRLCCCWWGTGGGKPLYWTSSFEGYLYSQVSFHKFEKSLYFKTLQARGKKLLGFFSCLLCSGFEPRPCVPGVHGMDRAHSTSPAAAELLQLFAVSRAFSRVSARSCCSAKNKRSDLGVFQHLSDSLRQRGEWQHLCLAAAVTLPPRMCSRILPAQSGSWLIFWCSML